ETGVLVVVVDVDRLTDPAEVADVRGQAARERNDLVLVGRPGEVRRPIDAAIVPQILRRESDLDAGVPRRADVFQNARVAGREGKCAREQQVVRILAIHVEAARDALIEDAVVETDVELVGRLPLEAWIRNRARAERGEVVRAAGVPRTRQETERLIRAD